MLVLFFLTFYILFGIANTIVARYTCFKMELLSYKKFIVMSMAFLLWPMFLLSAVFMAMQKTRNIEKRYKR